MNILNRLGLNAESYDSEQLYDLLDTADVSAIHDFEKCIVINVKDAVRTTTSNVLLSSDELFQYYIPKQVLLDSILVTTTSGKVFDGDEKSQDRMLRAVNTANITGETSTQWKMADNSIITVTLDELKEALTLAGKRTSEIILGIFN